MTNVIRGLDQTQIFAIQHIVYCHIDKWGERWRVKIQTVRDEHFVSAESEEQARMILKQLEDAINTLR